MNRHLLYILMLIFIGCESQTTTETSNSELLIIGMDVSQSAEKMPRITTENLKDFLAAITESNIGKTVLIAPIGNPSNEPFLKLNLPEIPVARVSGSLTERKKATIKANRIREKNQGTIDRFVERYEAEVVQRKAEKYTDLEGFFEKISHICQEPQYRDHKKTVMIYSDGKHSVEKKEGITNIRADGLHGVSFYTIGISNKVLIGRLNATQRVSPEAFFKNFLHQIKHSHYAKN